VAAVLVRARIEQVARLDDRRAGGDEVSGDVELAHDIFRVDTLGSARHAGDERQRAQVDEHVPGIAQYHGLVETESVCSRNCNRCGYGAHADIGPDEREGFFERRLPARRMRRMCRNIHTLHNFDPPATDEEVHGAALQYVRKISGFTKPSRANEAAFARAVDEVAAASRRLLDELVTSAPPKDREVEAQRKRERAAKRYAAA
jgi:hypothetical protein